MALYTTATAGIDTYTFTGADNNTLYLQKQAFMQAGDFFDGGEGTDKIQIRSSMAGEENFDVRGMTFESFEQLSYYPMSGMDMPGVVVFSSNQFGTDGSGNALISDSLFVIGSNYSPTDTQRIKVYMTAGDLEFDASGWTFTGWASSRDSIEVKGTAYGETIEGSRMADKLSGAGGTDILIGNGGGDIIAGGRGHDIMTGGSGRDTFDFNRLSEIGKAPGARDIITDFKRRSDDLDLSGLDASSRKAGNQEFDFIGRKGFHKVAGEVHYRFEGSSTIVEGDTNGDGKADFQIEIQRHVSLASGDFIL